MRLDKNLVEVCGTRTRAQDAIAQGRVLVNGKVIYKASYDVKAEDSIEVIPDEGYASRGAYKLKGALDAWHIDLKDRVVLDIGASTGGFTDLCLREGARKVYALDVGHLQLADSLRNDERVICMEGVNAREVSPAMFEEAPDFVCMDVSFISAKKIIEPFATRLAPDEAVILVKPQFEAGPQALNGRGILKNEKTRERILNDMAAFANQYYKDVQIMDCPLPGRDGNREALLHLKGIRP